MVKAGSLVGDMRSFIGGADPKSLLQKNDFKKKRDALQKQLASMVKASKARFDEPWGTVCLFWAAGCPAKAYGKAVASGLTLERGVEPNLAVSPAAELS